MGHEEGVKKGMEHFWYIRDNGVMRSPLGDIGDDLMTGKIWPFASQLRGLGTLPP